MSTSFPMRRIRSFVRRDGRITEAQKIALEKNWSMVGLQLNEGMIDFSRVFHRAAPRIVEIGFGSGMSLLAMAMAHPEKDFIGIEMHQPGIGSLILGMQENKINNIRIYYADAVEVLERCIPADSLDVVQIFFPDPWPKRRHHKRRLIQTPFVNLVVGKLKSGGMLHVATDWEDYARDMMKILSNATGLVNASGIGQYSHRSSQRPVVTKFERRGQNCGRDIWDLQFEKMSVLTIAS